MPRVSYVDMKLKHNYNVMSDDKKNIVSASGMFVFDGEKVSRSTLNSATDSSHLKLVYCGTCGRLIDNKKHTRVNTYKDDNYQPNDSYMSNTSMAETRTVGTLESSDTVSMITNDDRLLGLRGYVKSYIRPKGPKTINRYSIGSIKEHGDPEKLENRLPHINNIARDDELEMIAKDYTCRWCGQIATYTGGHMSGAMTSWQQHQLQIQADIGKPLFINHGATDDDRTANDISTVTSGFSSHSYAPHIDESPEYAGALLVFGYHDRNKKSDDKIDMNSPKYRKFLETNIPRGSTEFDRKEVLCNSFQRISQKSNLKIRSTINEHAGSVRIPKGTGRPLYSTNTASQDRSHFVNTSKSKHLSRLKIY